MYMYMYGHVVLYIVVWIMKYGIMEYGIMKYGIMEYGIIEYNGVWNRAVWILSLKLQSTVEDNNTQLYLLIEYLNLGFLFL